MTTWSPGASESTPVADALDDAGALVPEDGRRVAGGVGARGRVEIGVADAAGDEPDEDLARLRLGQLDLLHLERRAELLQHRGADLHRVARSVASKPLVRCVLSQNGFVRRAAAAAERDGVALGKLVRVPVRVDEPDRPGDAVRAVLPDLDRDRGHEFDSTLGGVRICLVTPFAWSLPHDVNQHVAGIAKELRALGHTVTVLAPSGRPADLAAGRRALARGDTAETIAIGTAVPISRRSSLGVPVGVRANVRLALQQGPSTSSTASSRVCRAFPTSRCATPRRSASRASSRPTGSATRRGGRCARSSSRRIDSLIASSETTAAAAAVRFPGDYRSSPRASTPSSSGRARSGTSSRSSCTQGRCPSRARRCAR